MQLAGSPSSSLPGVWYRFITPIRGWQAHHAGSLGHLPNLRCLCSLTLLLSVFVNKWYGPSYNRTLYISGAPSANTRPGPSSCTLAPSKDESTPDGCSLFACLSFMCAGVLSACWCFMCAGVWTVCLCNTCVSGTCRGQKRASGPLELESQTFVSLLVNARNQTRPSGRTTSTLNH